MCRNRAHLAAHTSTSVKRRPGEASPNPRGVTSSVSTTCYNLWLIMSLLPSGINLLTRPSPSTGSSILELWRCIPRHKPISRESSQRLLRILVNAKWERGEVSPKRSLPTDTYHLELVLSLSHNEISFFIFRILFQLYYSFIVIFLGQIFKLRLLKFLHSSSEIIKIDEKIPRIKSLDTKTNVNHDMKRFIYFFRNLLSWDIIGLVFLIIFGERNILLFLT